MTNISHRAIRIAAATAFLMAGAGLAGSATAATVFSDNFDGAPSGSSLNAAPTNWSVISSSGAVITNGWTTVSNVAATQGYTLISWLLTPDKDYANASVFFEALGDDNVGPLLDDVTLTAVPLPAAAWLLLSGLAGFAALGRRRARVAEA